MGSVGAGPVAFIGEDAVLGGEVCGGGVADVVGGAGGGGGGGGGGPGGGVGG